MCSSDLNKDKINVAHAGLGAVSHLCSMLLRQAIGVDLTTVPFGGTGPAMNALLGSQVDLLCDQTTNTTQHIRAGAVRTYGVTTRSRLGTLPGVPTLDEQGIKGFDVAVWHGLYAPRGTPRPVLERLNAALQAAVRDANFRARLEELGAEPVAPARATPDSLRNHLKAEIEKWGPVIRKAGVYAD